MTRDIALVMEEGTTVGSVLDVIRKTGGALLEKAEMFDIYRGAQLLSGKKSVAFSLTFRNAERTLSDDDVNPLMQKIRYLDKLVDELAKGKTMEYIKRA